MNTTKSRDLIQIGGKQVSLHGKFRLTCRKNPAKFFVTNINANVPYGKTIADKDYFYDENGKKPFLLISKIHTIFNPDISDIDAKNVAALIRNEDVRLEDMTDAEHEELVRRRLKKPNPEFTLVNLDKSMIDKHEEDLEMIELKYLITTKKKDSLSKKKLMYITSAMGLSVKSDIQDEVRYMAFLQRQLMDFLTANKDRRKDFMYFYEKISDAEIMYYINQFIEVGYIQNFGGIFKISDIPVGMSISDVKSWFAQNEDEYKAYKLKIDEFNSDKVTK